jgi:ribonuclease E
VLDTDPTDSSDGTDATSVTPDPTSAAAPADGTPPPAKAPRRRRATKAAAAPAADEPSDAGTETEVPAAESPAADAPAPDAPAPDAGPPKKAPRKRAPRKAAAKAAPTGDVPAAGGPADASLPEDTGRLADPAVTDTAAGREPGVTAELSPEDQAVADALAAGTPVVVAVEDRSDVAEAGISDATAPADALETPAPAKRTRTRRAPAVVSFQAPEPAATTDEEPAEVPAPRRRRRAGTDGAVKPADLVPTLLPPADRPADTGDDEAPDEDDESALRTDDTEGDDRPRRRRRGRRGRGPRRPEDEQDDDGTDGLPPAQAPEAAEGSESPDEQAEDSEDDDDEDSPSGTRRRRRRRRRGGSAGSDEVEDEPGTVVHVREPRQRTARAKDGGNAADEDGVRGISGSTRMAAKRVRRQEGRDAGRGRKPILSEAEFLARREAVDRVMVVRQRGDRTQIAVLEDGVLVEHYVTKASAQSYAGNVYLGRVQNVLPSMEAAFVDIGKGRNAVLYAGEVNWAGAGGGARKIESHLKSGQEVLVQVSKDPIGHKGARLTGQVSLPGRYLVYVPEGSMTGISRKLPETERDRLKAILKKVVPDDAGVIIRTAAEGASEEEIAGDVRRLQAQWEVIRAKAEKGGGPTLLHAEPDLVIRVIRDVFNEDFRKLVVQGDSEWDTIREYVEFVAPDLADRLSRHTSELDVFSEHRVDEQLAKALDRKVWLPSGGSLVIDRTEAMVVIDVNTGKYVGKGGNLEETVTRNNLEAAEEIARQLRLRDLGGIIVVDFIDMVLESNRDLVVRRLVECMGRDRTKHQVAEVTSLGLVQMTRKRVGQGLLESFSEPCERCNGRGVLVSSDPVDERRSNGGGESGRGDGGSGRKSRGGPKAVAEASARAKAPTDQPADATPVAAGTEDAPDGPPRRRRRGGRGAGAATLAPSDEMAELLAETPPDLADQPTAAQEDLPVLPPDLISVTDAEPAEDEATAARVEARESALPGAVPDREGAPATEPTSGPDPMTDDAPADPSPAPRRRRRATSRPAGPPAV